MMKDVDEMFCQKDVEKILCQRRPGWNQVKLGDIVKFEKYQHYKQGHWLWIYNALQVFW